jgi:hypothetical protein
MYLVRFDATSETWAAYPDGSAAYPAPGSSPTKIRILRILPCS